MIKFDTLFKRGKDGKVIPEINPVCSWVLGTENGLMTIKLDGITVRPRWVAEAGTAGWRIDKFDKRLDAWITCDATLQENKPIWEAWQKLDFKNDGVYVVYGRDIKGNPHNLADNLMIKIQPVDYNLIVAKGKSKIRRGPGQTAQLMYNEILDEFLESPEIEGLVFHLEDTGMGLKFAAKITKADYGLPWPEPKVVIDMQTSNVIPSV